MTDTPAGEPAGADAPPLGEQATALLAAVQDWARRNFDVPTAGAGATEHAEHATVCQWCPLCQFVAVLRGDRPEVTERVAAAGAAVLSAVQAMLDTVDGTARADPTSSSANAAAGPRVHKIDLEH